MKTFKFLSDPGHGWLRVTLADLFVVGLTTADISSCSYRKANWSWLYLEEDCDASKFVAAYEKKFGYKPNFSESVTDGRSFIRSLPYVTE